MTHVKCLTNTCHIVSIKCMLENLVALLLLIMILLLLLSQVQKFPLSKEPSGIHPEFNKSLLV